MASRSSLKPNTVGAVLRGDPTSTRTLTAIAAGFGVGVAALFDDGAPEPADHWTAALEHLDAAGRTLAAARVDATARPELTPDAAADVERAALAVHRALEAIGEAAVEVRVGRALSAFVQGAEPAESFGSMSGPRTPPRNSKGHAARTPRAHRDDSGPAEKLAGSQDLLRALQERVHVAPASRRGRPAADILTRAPRRPRGRGSLHRAGRGRSRPWRAEARVGEPVDSGGA